MADDPPGPGDDTSPQQGESPGNDDIGIIESILSQHDTNGKISKQIYEHLEKDQITLPLLSEFDDNSLTFRTPASPQSSPQLYFDELCMITITFDKSKFGILGDMYRCGHPVFGLRWNGDYDA